MLRAVGLTKRFFGNTVLADADLTLHAGQVHGLVGENGAGKSTLMKILAGVYQPDEGHVELDGEERHFTPPGAGPAGRRSSTVFQEFNLLPERTVAENIYLGREPRRAGFVDTGRMAPRHRGAARPGSASATSSRAASSRALSVAEQQIVEIAKAVSSTPGSSPMDEPTAALADHEVELLYAIIERLTERGVAILYVSHRLKEIFDLCDTITVLKDGRLVTSQPAAELDEAALVRLMVGRPISTYFPDAPSRTRPSVSRGSSCAARATATSTAST